MGKKVEIFSAGCQVCSETAEMVKSVVSDSHEVAILDMKDDAVANRAKELGVKSIPAIAIDGKLAGCCQAGGPDGATIKNELSN